MSEIAERYLGVADRFAKRAREIPGAWEFPTPCDGWVARDVVRHFVGWISASSRIPAARGCQWAHPWTMTSVGALIAFTGWLP